MIDPRVYGEVINQTHLLHRRAAINTWRLDRYVSSSLSKFATIVGTRVGVTTPPADRFDQPRCFGSGEVRIVHDLSPLSSYLPF